MSSRCSGRAFFAMGASVATEPRTVKTTARSGAAMDRPAPVGSLPWPHQAGGLTRRRIALRPDAGGL